MRRQLVTVRRPGASMAPSNNTCAWSQTRRENKGAKTLRTEANSGGKDGKQDHFPGHLYTTDPSRNGQSRANEVVIDPTGIGPWSKPQITIGVALGRILPFWSDGHFCP